MATIEEVDAQTIKRNSLHLAERLWNLEAEPRVVYAVLRGGAFPALPMHEYYNYWNKQLHRERTVKLGVIFAESYDDMKQGALEISLIYPDPREVKGPGSIVICDDVHDTGRTMHGIFAEFEKRFGVHRRVVMERADALEIPKVQMMPHRYRNILFVTNDLKLQDEHQSLEDLPDLTYTCWDSRTKNDEIKDHAHKIAFEVKQRDKPPFLRYETHELIRLEPEDLEKRFGLKRRET